MDPIIAIKLDDRKENPFFDAELSKKIGTVAREYIDCGLQALNFYIADFDAAADLVEMYAPVENAAEFAKMDRNSPLNFRHPMTFTEMTTLTTFIAEILFGGEQARSVEAQGPDDDAGAESINSLLAWNDSKLSIYKQGYLWIWDSVCFNRGVWFESGATDVKIIKETVLEPDITAEMIPLMKQDGLTPRMRNGEPVMVYPKIERTRTKRVYTGFHNRIDLVSPYDFVCDPALPLTRFQEGRFAGHRVMIPWMELERRSKLPPSDDSYVLPHIVEKIKAQKGTATAPAPLGGAVAANTSRAAYDRNLRGAASAGVGGVGSGLVAGADAVNKDDGGTIECFSMTIRAKPSALGMYPEDEESELMTVLVTNRAEVLSINVRPNKHDEFPYAVGEARPNAHRQFAPGIALAIKPVQDRVDQLNRIHAQAQARMGNILLADGTKVDLTNLLNPDKNGLIAMLTEQGRGTPLNDVLKQIPLQDVTANYNEEMAMWKLEAETATGAHAYVQGSSVNEDQTATQFAGTQEMATGRISSIARLLSEGSIVPQTRRFVENLQQFMPEQQVIRVLGKGADFDPDQPQQKFKTIKRADIQCEYDVVPHDGSLPGADAQVVAAASRAIEAWSNNPALATAFDPTIPGALDPIRIFRDLLKKSGLPVDKFSVTREQAIQNLQAKQLSSGTGVQPGMQLPAPAVQPALPKPMPANV